MAAVRQRFDERWRETIRDLVRAAQHAGEFGSVDAEDFAVTLSALRAFGLTMRFAAGQLGGGG